MRPAYSACIIGTGSYTPPRIVPNAALANETIYKPDGTLYEEYNPAKLEEIAGIRERRYTDLSLQEMMAEAAFDLFDSVTLDGKRIDYVICGTNSNPDNIEDISVPAVRLLQKRLGTAWSPEKTSIICGCPVGEACEDVAKQLIETERAKHVLVLTAENLKTDPYDMNKGLFGHAGGAALYAAEEDGEIEGLEIPFIFHSAGSRTGGVIEDSVRHLRTALHASALDLSGLELLIVQRMQGIDGVIVPSDASRIQKALAESYGLASDKEFASCRMGALDVVSADDETALELGRAYIESDDVQSVGILRLSDRGEIAAAVMRSAHSREKRTRRKGIQQVYRRTNGFQGDFIPMEPSYNPHYPDRAEKFLHIKNKPVYVAAKKGIPDAVIALLGDLNLREVLMPQHNTNLRMIEETALSILEKTGSDLTLKEFMEMTTPIIIHLFGNLSGVSVQYGRDFAFKRRFEPALIPSSLKSHAGTVYEIGPNYHINPGKVEIDVSVGAGMTFWGKRQIIGQEYFALRNREYFKKRGFDI
ncbi:MAG: hypothetical protein V1743_03955 [Nanoarchaeota archaeon]